MASVASGGKRPGAGRKPADPSGEKRALKRFFITDAEAVKVRAYIDKLRAKHKPKT